MLWFVDGSGGESHLWRLSHNWFPERTHETPRSELTRPLRQTFDLVYVIGHFPHSVIDRVRSL